MPGTAPRDMNPARHGRSALPLRGRGWIGISLREIWLALALCGAAYGAEPAPVETLRTAVESGSAAFDFRYRFEHVDQDGIEEDAEASTLRTRFTWISGLWHDAHVGLEADYVSIIGPEHYNSTANGRTEYPVVADPEGFDLNQAFVRYQTGALSATGGRQRILHDDQRFVGGVGWRQNEQTYDAVRLQAAPLEGLTLDYAYVANVNRVFGPDGGAQAADWQGDSHLFTAAFAPAAAANLSAFAYLLDFENGNGLPDSTATYGVAARATLKAVTLGARYARQTDYADNPLDFETDYIGLTVEAKLKPVSFNAGWEQLGSDDGVAGFRTPLATLHKFQGWADKFLATPDAGIRDAFAGIGTRLADFSLAATYHDFSSDAGSADYGTELDLAVTYHWRPDTTVQLKYADYDADDFATDTRKAWLTVNVKL